MEQKTKKPIYKKWWFWLILIIIICGIGASNTDVTQPTSTSTSSTTQTQQPIEYKKVTVDDLYAALENNAAVAKDTYNNQYLEVTGKLSNIDSDLKYISINSTTNPYSLKSINCYIKNNEQKEVVKTLSKDDTIVVKGKIISVGEVLGYSLDITEISK